MLNFMDGKVDLCYCDSLEKYEEWMSNENKRILVGDHVSNPSFNLPSLIYHRTGQDSFIPPW